MLGGAMHGRNAFGTVMHNGYLYIMGGLGYPLPKAYWILDDSLNDVWRSKDGLEWELMTEQKEEKEGGRYYHKSFTPGIIQHVVSFRGMIYLLKDNGEGQMTAWVSPEGKDWYELARVKKTEGEKVEPTPGGPGINKPMSD
jgi:hypothetical protein